MKKRILVFALALCLVLTLLPFGAAAAGSGSCGDNVSWTLDDDGTLRITGRGDMTDYASYDKSPFYNNTDVKKIVIGSGVTKIGNFAFFCCSEATSVTIPSSVTRIGEAAFSLCYALTGVTIPSTVSSIADYAFYGCAGLTGVTIPAGVEDIGVSAFAGCLALKSIAVASVNARYCSVNGALLSKDKTELLQVPAGVSGVYEIPDGVGRIGVSAFEYCINLTDVKIPESVTSIDRFAFSDCLSMEGVFIPVGVTTLGESAFSGCSGLKDVWFGGSESRWSDIGGGNAALSEDVQLHFNILCITAQPQDVRVNEGGQAVFSVAADGPGLSWQWQYQSPGTEEWYDSGMDGARTATLTVPATAARNGQQYRCKVRNEYGTVTSEAAMLSVNPAPRIAVQPKSVTAIAGNTVKLRVEATGEGLTSQWQYKTAGKTTWYDSGMTGAKTAEILVPATMARSGQQYRCIVKNAAGSAVSNAAKLTVVTSPAVTKQPKIVSAVPGDSVKFTVTATGGGLSYQWQFKAPGTSEWHNSGMTGAKTATLTVPATTARSGQQYRCIVKNAAGSVTSNAGKLVVSSTAKPTVMIDPKAVTAKAGDTVTFTVEASGGTGLSWQWQFKAPGTSEWHNSGMTGAKTAAISVPATAARSGQQYRCIVTNAWGSDTSAPAKLTVK